MSGDHPDPCAVNSLIETPGCSPVEGRVAARGVNLDGDDQADRQAHGGPDKAVYAYPTEHLPDPVPLLQNGKDRFYNPTSDIDATFDGAGLTMVADNAKMRVERVKSEP